jgi:hypothetical protein
MAQASLEPGSSSHPQGNQDGHGKTMLGPLLCWAVVFADIGSSIYYTPGILYGSVGKLAGFFVILTMTVFVLLTLKYAVAAWSRWQLKRSTRGWERWVACSSWSVIS